MLKYGFVFLDLCSCVSDLVLMFKFGFVFLSLYFCVSKLVLCSLNGFGVEFGLVSLKEMRPYRCVFLYFGACCVCIMGMCLNFLGLSLGLYFFFFFYFVFLNLIKIEFLKFESI